MLQKPTAIGLDVDGVLRPTGFDAFLAFCKAVRELGGTAPKFNDFVRDYSSKFLEYYQSCGVTSSREEIFAVYQKHLNPHDIVPPYSDVATFLSWCVDRFGLTVFAVSTHPHDQLEEWLSKHGIRGYFSHVKGGTRDKVVCLTEACSILGLEPGKGCYVGDWGLDMRAAKTVGLAPIGLTRGHDSQVGLEESGAVAVFDHFHALALALSGVNKIPEYQHEWI